MTVSTFPSAVKRSAGMEHYSPLRLWAATSANFAYGFMMADQGMLLAPLEAERLFLSQASLGLSAMAICSGLSQLTGPAAGRWSDRHRSTWGRRRPCLMMAVFAMCLLNLMLTVCSELRMSWAFIFVFFLQQFAWNCIQTVQAGLIPDVVLADQHSIAGGMAAANTLGGAFAALFCVRFLSGIGVDAHYALMMGIGVLCVVLVCMAAKERSSHDPASSLAEASDATAFLSQLAECYTYDSARYPEFTKLLLSKTLYAASVIVKGFLLFFIQDTFKLSSQSKEQAIIGDTAVAAEAVAVVAALLAIKCLDTTVDLASISAKKRDEEESAASSVELPPAETPVAVRAASDDGAKRARIVAFGGALWMCIMWFGPVCVGLGVLTDQLSMERSHIDVNRQKLADRWAPYMIAGTAVWGIGQGLYLAGDQALGYALLPSRDEASRLMGLTSVCTAFGAVMGGAVIGGLLYTFGAIGQDAFGGPQRGTTGPGYTYPGYVAIFVLASMLSGGSSIVLKRIQTHEMGSETDRIVEQ